MIASAPKIRLAALAALLCATASAQEPPEDEPVERVSPIARAVLETPREEPVDYARAVFVLLDLGEPKLAVPVLDELIGLGLDDEAKAALVTEFGSARFLRLAGAAELQPQAAELASQCMGAARAQTTSPERLAELVERLGSSSEPTQAAALAALQRAGHGGVAFCLARIAEAEREEQNRLREALVALGPLSRAALVAMLDSSDPELRKQAAWALGQRKDFRAAPLLAAQAVLEPSGSDAGRAAQWAFRQINNQPASTPIAKQLLDGALRDALKGVPPDRANAEDRIAVYERGAEESVATEPRMLPAADAGLVHAARLAWLRMRVDPSQESFRRRAMLLDLEARTLLEAAGLNPPSREGLDPSGFTNEALSSTLTQALEANYSGAATALCVMLGDRGDRSVLITGGGRPSPLAAALKAPHPAVRFAALRHVMGLKPDSPYPGSSGVPASLLRFASSRGVRGAVVAMPNVERSTTLAGYLASLGIEARATNQGGQAVKLADWSDAEFVLIDLALLRPHVRETLFRLRRQTTTALAPIALLAPAGRLEEAKRIAKDHRRVLAFSRPQNLEAVRAITDALSEVTPAGWPTAAERLELAEVATQWTNELLSASIEGGPTFYDLRGPRVDAFAKAFANRIDQAGVEGLALLGTPLSQQELLLVVNQRTLPIELRRQAAQGFKQSIERFGPLLTTEQIQMQYDRYNASELADEATQKVLGDVLDTIEAKRNRNLQEQNSGE